MTLQASKSQVNRGKEKINLPSLVHFFGPDGSGKSLQATILVESLEKQGFRVRKCWLRAHHTLAFILWRILVGIGFYNSTVNIFGVVTKVPAVSRSRVLSLTWSYIEFVSVLPIILRLDFLILRGYHLVAERYVLDTVTSIAHTLNDINFLNGKLSHILFTLMPKNSVFIFLDSDYSTIQLRRTGIAENKVLESRISSPEFRKRNHIEPKSFISFQRTAYKAIAPAVSALTIDTSFRSIEETSTIIMEYLKSK